MARKQWLSVGDLTHEGFVNKDGVTCLTTDTSNNVTSCKKAGTPPSATTGYAVGCEFTDTSTGAKYVNTGSATSCTFTSGTLASTLTLSGNTPIALTGTAVTKGINFAGVTPAFTSQENAFIAIGTYTSALAVANTGSTFIPVQVNLSSTGNTAVAGQQVAAARLRVDSDTNHQANTAIHVLQLRSDIATNVYAAACVNASLNISAATTVGGETVQCAYFSITGAGAITCSADVNVLEATYKQTAGGSGVDNVAQLSCNATDCTITNVLDLVNYAGTVTNLINLRGTSTFGIKVSATIPDLLQLTAGSAGTSCVFTNAAVCAVATSHALRIDIGGTPHYLPVFSDLSWGS